MRAIVVGLERFTVLILSLGLAVAAPNTAAWAQPAATACPVGGHTILSCPVRTDEVIAGAIAARLAGSVVSSGNQVCISVADGVVTLSGQVRDQGKRDLASILAHSVEGVRQVNNRMAISPVGDYDLQIIGRVRTELRKGLINSRGISVDSSDGVVRLSGMVSSDLDRTAAGIMASGVPGVVAVQNNLIARAPGSSEMF